MMPKKEPKHICKFCLLYNEVDSICPVRLIVGGQVFRNIPVLSKDPCLWEELGVADHIKETRFATVDPLTGEPTSGNGRVIIEYDAGFFGKNPEVK